MDINALKAILACAIFIIGVLGSSLPWGLSAATGSSRFLALGNTFAAGILGGAGLIHLLTGGAEAFGRVAPEIHYPLAFLLAGLAFLFILFIEGVIIGAHHYDENSVVVHPRYGHELPSDMFTNPRHVHAFILLIILSIHSVILGLALGAQQSFSRIIAIFIAIIAHKGFAGFAMGTGYQRAGYTLKQTWKAILLFSLMAPVGVLIGTGASAILTHGAGLWFTAVFNSIGAGTFLYIASLDILRTEFDEHAGGNRMIKWILTTAGFGIMALLALWI